jgi:molybdate transport system substrate-binding protein
MARVAIGVAVKKGAPQPDISTPEAFKNTLRNAKSISLSSEGASGVYFAGLLERLGDAAEIKPKLRPVPGGPFVVGPVAKGEVEIAVISIPYIVDEPGADLVGPLPAELQQYVVYTAGIGAAAHEAEAGSALIKYFKTPESSSLLKSKGLDHATP